MNYTITNTRLEVTHVEDAVSVVRKVDAMLILFSISAERFQQRDKQIARL